KYSKVEDVNHVSEIEHPIIRTCLERFNIKGGIEIASLADIPAGTGLGSSSTFTVGLLHALYAYEGRQVSHEQLAQEACEIEIDILKKPIGKQDQYAAAYGGVRTYTFNADESVSVQPVMLSQESRSLMEDNLALYYLDQTRNADTVLKDQNSDDNREKKADTLRKMVDQVGALKQELESGNVGALGRALDAGWQMKKTLSSKIGDKPMDDLYKKAMNTGATGGKILGAGGGGFMLFYAGNQTELSKSLERKSVPFKVDNEGSKVIFYEQQ
ncbi:MAG: GHMP kinase, partial [Alphaproteobacteria bacterium]